jgi:hypothetical protein
MKVDCSPASSFPPENNISWVALRALCKTAELDNQQISDVLHLLDNKYRGLFRKWIREALQTGISLRIISDETHNIPYPSCNGVKCGDVEIKSMFKKHHYEFLGMYKIQRGDETLGYIGNAAWEGFCLI